jgi:hypothetical protein
VIAESEEVEANVNNGKEGVSVVKEARVLRGPNIQGVSKKVRPQLKGSDCDGCQMYSMIYES